MVASEVSLNDENAYYCDDSHYLILMFPQESPPSDTPLHVGIG